MKNLTDLGANALSRNQLMQISGGNEQLQRVADPVGCHQCCGAWGCGQCGCGTSHDCSIYGDDVRVQQC